jgi:putative MFS transporter
MAAAGRSPAELSINERLDRLPVTTEHKRVIAILALGNFFEIYELFLSGVLATTLKKSFGLSGLTLSVVLASGFVGAFLGAIVIGRLADRSGRRRAYVFTLTLYSAFSLLGALSPTVWALVVFRFFAGIGLGGELPVTDSYLSDVLPARNRGRYAAWAFTIAYLAVPVVGFLGVGLVDANPFGVDGWRWMFAIGSLGAVTTFAVRRRLPESPRWLESVGRHSEADAVVSRFERAAADEGWTPPAERATASRLPAVPTLSAGALLRSPLRRRTALMAAAWIIATIGYYGFSNIATLSLTNRGFSVTNSLLYSSVSFIGYPIGSMISVPIMDRYERKWILVASLLAMAGLGLGFGYATTPVQIVAFGFLLTCAANVMSNAIHIYQSELFPTSVRTTATGWLYSLGRLSIATVPFYLIPLLNGYGPGAVFALIGTALLLGVTALAVFGPRTTGLTVEAISRSATASASPSGARPEAGSAR